MKDEVVLIPLVNEAGETLSEEEAIKQYLDGELPPIRLFESTDEIDREGWKPLDKVAWPWVTQYPEDFDTIDPYD